VKRPALTALFVLLASSFAAAQTAGPSADLRAGGLVSIQPKGYESSSSPYLDKALGGIVPGVSASVNITTEGGLLLAAEFTTTTAMSEVQSGRFIVGRGPVEARHRDTLLSALAGFRLDRRADVEVKGGISLLFGTPEREAFAYDDPAGVIGFTGGIDVVAPVSARVAVVPSFRYTYAVRGDDGDYFGLGRHIFRIGVGVAFALAR
jgi:hypothetical protein